MTLNERIQQLEQQIKSLTAKIQDLSKNTEDKYRPPTSTVGGNAPKNLNAPVDTKTGMGRIFGGAIIWNDSELKIPPINVNPPDPTKGYNKHSHSRYSGGALIKDELEIVEFDWDNADPIITNKHSQAFWINQPPIKTEINSKNETVEKIGKLDLVFNPDTLTWGVASIEVDIRRCNFVERDENGQIVLDSKGKPKSAPLYNSDPTKTSIVWDKNGSCWRLYAVYAPDVSQV